MTNLIIKQSKKTLGIDFNCVTGVCTITGSSLPEDSSAFFAPVIDWISDFTISGSGKLKFELRVYYLNSSSIKFMSDIMEKLELFHSSGGVVSLVWYHDEDDNDSAETGADFREDVSFNFDIVAERAQ